MHRYQHLMVGLARTGADAGLIHYAAMVARLGTANQVCFGHVLPSVADLSAAPDHDRVLAELQAEVQPHLTGLPRTAEVSYDVLHGPLVDQLLVYVAEKQVDLLLV